MPVTNVLLAGVGGQGVVLASELLALAAIAAGHDAKQGEFHGVAQRGGSVFSHVRFGDRVFSPTTRQGEVHFLLALEKLEALRYAHFVRAGGDILVNDHEIEPIRTMDERPYPKDAVAFLKNKGFAVKVLKATELAVELGNHRAANAVMLGALAEQLEIPGAVWVNVLNSRIPERLLELNRKAFEIGRKKGH
ncbi:MAG: hypothetical protein AMS18_06405 [Gemmatimonas sp. SG8_17]|nr:MAG: hypothetical protein AMS18_06405 [Gemmatimonas sp. SG8_17]